MEQKTKKNLTVGSLAAVIVLTFGYTGYSLIYPPKAYLGEDENIAMEFMLKNACPFLRDQYEAVEVDMDGNAELEGSLEIMHECKRRIDAAMFEQALISEFSKHYK